jgi:hypothetical protein
MKINHTVLGYVVGGSALVLAGYAAVPKAADHPTPPAVHGEVHPGRLDWPVLGEARTIALGEAMHGAKPGKVILYCASPACVELRKDLDDAFQIAQWDADFEDRLVDSEAEHGIFVGPPGDEAQNLIAQLEKVGLSAKEVGITDDGGHPIQGLGIIIGKSGVKHEAR